MAYEITLPNGEVVEVDDSVPEEQAVQTIKKSRPDVFQPKTDLLSVEGVKGLFGTMGESVDASILSAKKGMHQEILDAMQSDLARYSPGTPEYQQQMQKIQAQQQTTHEYAAGVGNLTQSIQQQVPNPSIPMEAAMGVAPSLVNMAPSLLTRNPLPLAQQGLEQFRAQAYGSARDQGAAPDAAGAYGNISGPMEAITEWMPMGKLFDSLGKESTKALIVKTLGREIASEELNTIVDKAAEQAIVTPDKPLEQFISELGHDVAVTGLQAGMQTGLMAPMIGVMNSPGETSSNSRDLIVEAPPATPPADAAPIAFTDTDVAMQELQAMIDEVDAELGSGQVIETPEEAQQKIDAEPPPVIKNAAAVGLDTPDTYADAGMTAEVRGNKANFKDPNTATARAGRRITRVLGASADLAGQLWGDVDATTLETGGPVVLQVGEDSEVRPAGYLQAVVAELFDLAKEFNPNAIYVVLPEDAAMASHQRNALGYHFKKNGVHYIVPRHATRLNEEGGHANDEFYNANAKLHMGSTLWHEFGHSLIEDFFLAGLSRTEQTLFRSQLNTGNVTPEILSKLPPEMQALVNRWRGLKQAAEEGKMGGHEAAARFFSPVKLANLRLMKETFRLSEATMQGQAFGADRIVRPLEEANWWNFFEFAAEQMAKFQMQEGRLENSKLTQALFPEGFGDAGFEAALRRFFKPVMDILAQVFETLKARGFVKPEAEFSAFMQLLANRASPAVGKKQRKTKAPAKTKAAPQAPTESVIPEVEEVDWASPSVQQTLKAALASLVSTHNSYGKKGKIKAGKKGLLELSDPQYLELKQLLNDEMYEEFVSAIEPLLEQRIKFDQGNSTPVNFRAKQKKKLEAEYLALVNEREELDIKAQEMRGFVNEIQQAVNERWVLRKGEAPWSYQGKPVESLFQAMQIQKVLEKDVARLEARTLELEQKAQDIIRVLDPAAAFIGTMVHDRRGEPLQVFMFERYPLRVDGQAVLMAGANEIELIKRLGGMLQEVPDGIPTPGFMGIYSPLIVQKAGGSITRQEFEGLVRQAREAGHDGLILRQLAGSIHPLYFAFSQEQFLKDLDYSESASLRFDLSTPEGEQGHSIWKMAKQKLGSETIALAMHKLYRQQFNVLQMQHLGHVHPEWQAMRLWEETRQKFYRKVAQMHSAADAVSRQLQWAGKERLAKLYKITLAEYRGAEHWTEIVPSPKGKSGYWEHQVSARLLEEMKKRGIDPDSRSGKSFIEIYLEAKNALQLQMDEMERVMLVLRGQKYKNNPQRLRAEIAQIRTTFGILRSKPFWPQQTFGKYIVQAWRTDENGKFLVYEAGTDDLMEAAKLEKEAKTRFAGDQITRRVRGGEEAILMRLPVEFVDDIAIALGLDTRIDEAMTEDEVRVAQENALKLETIRDMMQSVYNKTPMATYAPERVLVIGGSTDFLRNFADFSLSNSNFISKMEFRKYFDQAHQMAKAQQNALPLGKEFDNLEAAMSLMQDTVKYMMDPTEEAYRVRAFAAITYLWGNVKTAALNFWGLAHNVLYLNRELGYIRGSMTAVGGVAASLRTLGHEGMTAVSQILHGAAQDAFTSVTDPNWQMEDGIPTELRLALEQAKRENVLDQSFAASLAGQALRGDLMRMASRTILGKMAKATIDTGMAPFRVGELAIRRGTFISVYSALQKTQPKLSPEQRYEEAVRITGLLQGDYTKGNKPRIFRGQIMSVVTLFMTYVHNAAWGGYGGMEMGLRRQEAMDGRPSPWMYRSYTAQMMLLYLFVAGFEGLPGMENILDVVDAIYRKIYKRSARSDLRDLVQEMEIDPMKFMRGWTFDLGGLDVSRSIGLGRIIPGTDVLGNQPNRAADIYGDAIQAASGIAGGYASWLIDTGIAMNKYLEALPFVEAMGRVYESQMPKLPGGLGNLHKAHQWANVDARGPSGGLLAHDPDTLQAREIQQWEIVAKSLGFQPASVSVTQTLKADQYEAGEYWQYRRKTLLEELDHAENITQDREAIADINKAIAQFNRDVPNSDLEISAATERRSMKQRERRRQLEENFKPTQKTYDSTYEEVLQNYGK